MGRTVLLLLLACALTYTSCENEEVTIKKVHIVFMNHLDVGFNLPKQTGKPGFIYDVLDEYFNVYYPRALATSKALEGTEYNYIYTTHSWLVSFFKDCPSGIGVTCPNTTTVSDFDGGVKKGYISWHAYPFNAQAEAMDSSLFEFGFELTHRLDDVYNLPHKQVMSQRDVPSTTRSIIPHMLKHNVTALSIGCNGAVVSYVDGKPRVFWWKPSENSQQKVLTMIHPHGYGGDLLKDAVLVPGFNEAMIVAFKGDNQGPHTPTEAKAVFDQVRKEFPNAQVIGSTFDNFLNALNSAFARKTVNPQGIPDMYQEVGDTWINGLASDPRRMILFREIMMARTECLQNGNCKPSDPMMYNMSRFLIKNAEHTWGFSGHRINEWKEWTNADLQNNMKTNPKYKMMEQSYVEQMSYINHTVSAIPKTHPLYKNIQKRFEKIIPKVPTPSPSNGDKVHTPPKKCRDRNNMQTAASPECFSSYTCPNQHMNITFNSFGDIVSLTHSGQQWSSPFKNRLLQVLYSTYSAQNTTEVWKVYNNGTNPYQFNKTDVGTAAIRKDYRGMVYSNIHNDQKCEFNVLLQMDSTAHSNYGSPNNIWVSMSFDEVAVGRELKMELSVQWFAKTATRYPEATWLIINPLMNETHNWSLYKLDGSISPCDVITNGSQHQHAVWRVNDVFMSSAAIDIYNHHAPVVSPGFSVKDDYWPDPAPHMENHKGEEISTGMAFLLHDNMWSTNYPLWYPYEVQADPVVSGADIRMNFTIHLSHLV